MGYDVIDEGIGVIHERIVKGEYIHHIVQRYNLRSILEVGSAIGIEMGAGVGIDSLPLSKKNKNVVLIDHSKENLFTAMQIYKITGLRSKVCLVMAHPSYMPFKTNSFDLAFNSYLVEFEVNPVKCVREMMRVSKQFVLLFATNYLNIGHLIHKIYGGVIRAPWENGSKNRTTLCFLHKFVEIIGLKLVDSGAVDVPPWPSGVAIRKTEEYRLRKKLQITNPDLNPIAFKLLKLFYLFEKSTPKFFKILQSHIIYVLAKK